jgi:hypothetical protein
MRKCLIKKTLLLALMLVTGSVWAEWVMVSVSVTEQDFYIDKDTIRKDGNLRKVWSVNNLKQRDKYGGMSYRGRDEFDCKSERKRTLSVSLHSEPMADGKILFDEQGSGEWTDVPPDTPMARILKIVCAK